MKDIMIHLWNYQKMINFIKLKWINGAVEKHQNKQTNKQTTKKRTLYDYVERHEEAYRNNEIKSLVDFAEEYSSSIK